MDADRLPQYNLQARVMPAHKVQENIKHTVESLLMINSLLSLPKVFISSPCS